MNIGILQTGSVLADEYGGYGRMFADMLAAPDMTFRVYDIVGGGAVPTASTACDGWLITGSRFGVYEDLPWIRALEALVRDCEATNTPMVGVCFGHQLMAQAMHGEVGRFPGGWRVGAYDYTVRDTGETIRQWCFHQDQVLRAPPTATWVGRSAVCEYAMLAYGTFGFSIQAHPEFSHRFFEDLIALRAERLPEAMVHKGRQDVINPQPMDNIRETLLRFFRTRTLSFER